MTTAGTATDGKMILSLLLHLAIICWCLGCGCPGQVLAEEATGDAGYHTPLAGQGGEVHFMGRTIPIPPRDRRNITSLTLGGSILTPEQGSAYGTPIAALFLRRGTESYRTRDVVSLFVNELEYDRRFGKFEMVGHFENYTLPVDITELRNNKEMKETSVMWGSLTGSVGPGLRIPVAPFEVDNNLKLQLWGRVGYLYAGRTDHTGPDVITPPDTMVYGTRLRGRYDGIRRNMLELPHSGFATGFDLDYLHRDKWRSLKAGSNANHKDYMQVQGYVVGAGGIPGWSEKNRFMLEINGGKTSDHAADRYNAFLLNGGPFPSEEDDLTRPHYTGIFYNEVSTSAYVTTAVGYRRELTFFMYLSLVGSWIWGERATVQGNDQVVFHDRTGAAATVALDTAFLWDSAFYLAYTWESGFIRDGRPGGGITLLWNKMF